MDWNLAIERNLASLLRIAGTLFAMAGLNPESMQAPQPANLPRHVHSALLSILRPAESALRRLIVIAARNLTVTLTPTECARFAKALPPAQNSCTGIFWNGRLVGAEELQRAGQTRTMATRKAAQAADAASRPSFCLFDPLKPFSPGRQGPSQWVPRILFDLDRAAPVAVPEPASPDDPVTAMGLCRRLAALKSALDDLPGQARRLARWRARRKLRQGARGRLSPLRPGSPPGHRQRSSHPVDDVLHHCHGLAIDIAMRSDTS